VAIIDPSPAIAARVEQLLVRDNIKADADHIADYQFISAADDEYIASLKQFAEQIIK
jgi:hypothetical protein